MHASRSTKNLAFGVSFVIYNGGVVYSKYLNFIFGKEQVGSYESHPAEAAALVLLYLIPNAKNNGKKETAPPTNNSDSDSLFYLIVALFWGAIKLFLTFFKVYFVYIGLAFYASTTLYFLGSMVIFGIALGFTDYIMPLTVLGLAITAISIPYWIILFSQKRKRNMGYGKLFKYYGFWFIKGPFAYSDIMKLKYNFK